MILEGFYGQKVELREDLLYYPPQELWVQPSGKDGELAFGVTHAGVILVSGFTYLEYLAEVGDQLEKEDDVLFVETHKAIFNSHPCSHLRPYYPDRRPEGGVGLDPGRAML